MACFLFADKLQMRQLLFVRKVLQPSDHLGCLLLHIFHYPLHTILHDMLVCKVWQPDMATVIPNVATHHMKQEEREAYLAQALEGVTERCSSCCVHSALDLTHIQFLNNVTATKLALLPHLQISLPVIALLQKCATCNARITSAEYTGAECTDDFWCMLHLCNVQHSYPWQGFICSLNLIAHQRHTVTPQADGTDHNQTLPHCKCLSQLQLRTVLWRN